MNYRSFLSITVLFLFSPSLALAQQQPRLPERPPDGGTREVLISILIPSLPSAPFTGTLDTTWVRHFGDGTEITLKNHRKISRDKMGRIFQERRMLVPDDGKTESAITQIEISDPVKHELYICRPAEHVCQLEVLSLPEGADPSILGKRPAGPGFEQLGKQTMLGVETVGTRQITVIETGAIGNDRPVLVRREFWYSPHLGVNLLSIREDPRFGTQKFEFSELILDAPDTNLFEPPADATILDLRKPAKMPTQNSSPN
jgi:hypothetical protein